MDLRVNKCLWMLNAIDEIYMGWLFLVGAIDVGVLGFVIEWKYIVSWMELKFGCIDVMVFGGILMVTE